MRINNNKQNFTSLSSIAKPLEAFYNANATIPTLAIESGVTVFRTVEANKKGGKYEATERFIEQGVSAAVWLWGVQTLKKVGEFIGSNILKIGNLNFDVGFDELRNPIKNNKIGKKQAFIKSADILICTALATYFTGFILPKINKILTKKLTENKAKDKKQKSYSTINNTSFEQFKKQTNKNISFTSLADKTIMAAHTLENNSTARLLITDTGVIAGRCHSAKTKNHKIENLFRDISSIYFYLFSSPHIVKILNKLTSNTDINPKALEKTVAMLDKNLAGNKVDYKEFLKKAKGEGNIKNLSKLDELFKDKKIITVEEFCKTFVGFSQKAQKMSELQPIFNSQRVLSKQQATDVLNNGLSSDAEFLKSALSAATNGASDNKLKFVSRKELEKIRYSIDDFIEQISTYAKKNNMEVDKELITKIANKNLRKSFGFNVFAMAISTVMLGIVIPKIQYKIRKKLSNNDEFPGDYYYKNN